MFPRYGYVCASKTMALRRLLEAANSNAGFTNQEKGLCVCVCVTLGVAVGSDEHCRCVSVSVMRLRNAAPSAHQILKSSSTSFSSSFKSSLCSRSGDVAVTLHFQQHLSCLYASDIIDYFSNLLCSVKDFKLSIYLKVVLTFLPQINDSAASGVSPLPALPAHPSIVVFIPINSLPR